MINFLLKILSAVTNGRIPTLDQWQAAQKNLEHLQAKTDNLEEVIQKTRQRQQTDLLIVKEAHRGEIQILREQTEKLNQQLGIQRERSDQLQLNAERESQRHIAENKALLDQLNWLSGTIAHDFRAPLRAIDANSFFLRDDIGDKGPPDAHKTIDEISRNGKRMGVLIDGLLDYLRVGISPLNRVPIQLKAIINQTIESDFSLLQYPIEISDPHNHLNSLMKADKDLLIWMFKELLDNAVKFSSKAEPHPIVKIRSPEPDLIEIVDNGVGFKDEHRAQLFQLFHRLHGNDEYPGEGIGLCIAQRIAMRHGIELRLDRLGEQTVAGLRFKS